MPKEGGKEIPHPTIFLIDQERVIRDKLRYEGFCKWHKEKNTIEGVQRLRESADAVGLGETETRRRRE